LPPLVHHSLRPVYSPARSAFRATSSLRLHTVLRWSGADVTHRP
jgi:hypothetical protein